MKIISQLIKFGNNIIIKNILDFASFVIGLLNGQDVCSKTGELSFDLIDKIFLYPIETSEIILCYIAKAIGSGGYKLLNESLKLIIHLNSQFIRKLLLPGLHTVLNAIKDFPFLPPSLKAFIEAFNMFYKILHIIGYV